MFFAIVACCVMVVKRRLWAQAFQAKLRQDAEAQAVGTNKLLAISLQILNAHEIKVTFLH